MTSFDPLWDDETEENDRIAFKERWDFATKHSTEPPNESAHASDVILNALRAKHQSDTGRWLSSLAEEVSKPAAIAESQDRQQENATGALLDRMFNEFQKYASEFNQTVQGTDFIVNCLRPTFVYELPKDYSYNGDLEPGKISTFEGHLATRYWAMLLRGQYGKVEIFITPAINLLGFSAQKSKIAEIVPFMSIEAIWKDGNITWQIYGEELLPNAVAPLTKDLFGDLIKVASGSISESDVAAKMAKKAANEPIAESHAHPAKRTAHTSSLGSLKTVKVLADLITAVELDIEKLLENGKQALDANDETKLEKTRRLTVVLGVLLKSVKHSITEIKRISQK